MPLILGLKPVLPSSQDNEPLGSDDPDCQLALKIESPLVPSQGRQEAGQSCDGNLPILRNTKLQPKQPATSTPSSETTGDA